MLASAAEMVVIDFETTGAFEGLPNMPWQLGGVYFYGGRADLEHGFSVYLRVPREHPFNPYTPGRWASIREQLAEAPSLVELWPRLQPWLQGKVLVAHHAPTERSMLQQIFPFHSFGPWLDTLNLARRAYPGLPEYKLEYLTETLGLKDRVKEHCPDLEPHDAYYDSVACALLLEHILTLPGWNQATVEELGRIH